MSTDTVDCRLQSIETSINLLAKVEEKQRKTHHIVPTVIGSVVGVITIITAVCVFAKWAMDSQLTAELAPVVAKQEAQGAVIDSMHTTLTKVADQVNNIDKTVAVLNGGSHHD